jgi:Uma2 family endonuclease
MGFGQVREAIAMVLAQQQQTVSFDEFIDWLPESATSRYELHRGAIVEMPKPKGRHSELAGLIMTEISIEIRRLQVPWFMPKECIVKSLDGKSGYEPDAVVLDRPALVEETRWESGSIITLGKSIKLILEVVSSNWQDDYLHKLADYEALGIQEYWIADYLGLGGRRYIGNPKQPTFTVCSLVDGEYELQQFRGLEAIASPTFPDLQLTVDQVFNLGL